jgi:hypothetical protein
MEEMYKGVQSGYRAQLYADHVVQKGNLVCRKTRPVQADGTFASDLCSFPSS